MADDKIVVHDHGDEQNPGGGKEEAEGKLQAFLQQGERLTDEEKAKRKIVVFSKQKIREFVLSLISELAGKSCADHIKEIYTLREQLNGLSSQAAKEIEELKRIRQQELDDLRKEFNDLIAQMKADHEAELARVREQALGEAKERIIELEKLIEIERGRAADLDARLAAALAEIEKLNVELAALRQSMSGQDARTKAELLKLIAQLEARIHELEIGLDYFDLEEEFDNEAFQQEAAAASEKLAAAGTPVSTALHNSAQRAAADAGAAVKKIGALRQVMFENKASIAVVVDIVKQIKDAEAARARVQVAQKTLS